MHWDRVAGIWSVVDKKARKYRIVWVDEKGRLNGFIDLIVMSPDGSTISGKSNKNHTFTGKKVKR